MTTQTTAEKMHAEAKRLAEVCDKRSRIYTEESSIANNEHSIYLALLDIYQMGVSVGSDGVVEEINKKVMGDLMNEQAKTTDAADQAMRLFL